MTNSSEAVWYLGVECGGTHSTAVAECSSTGERLEWKGGPANLRLSSDDQLLRRFRSIRRALPRPLAIAFGMAGVRTKEDIQRIHQLSNQVWPDVPCFASHDLETALAAAPTLPGSQGTKPPIQVLILSGTGSCCLGRAPNGRTVKIGGWGHFLGDKGSAYDIGIRALKAVVYYLDRDRKWSLLGTAILRRLLLNEPNDLIDWVKSASKDQVAAIAMEVFEAAGRGDSIARDILQGAAASLSRDALDCARRLTRKREQVQFVFAGSVLLRQPHFAKQVRKRLMEGWKTAAVTPLEAPSVLGAVALARRLAESRSRSTALAASDRHRQTEQWRGRALLPVSDFLPTSTALSPTERRNPRSTNLDRLSLDQSIELFLNEDRRVPSLLLKHRRHLAAVIQTVVHGFQRGGRLFYVGAGTSGRLGVLDASECPPTFRTPREWVQGIMAGGAQALWESVEGAEDNADQGAQAVTFRGIAKKDVVVGIAASGRTPFVWGALEEARRRGAKTVLLCFNPYLQFQPQHRPDHVLAVDLGPELLTGSTRLKAGTATKLILNLITTLSMVRLGKVARNLMIDLNPSNAKLRERAKRILIELTGTSPEKAEVALEATHWDVKAAWQRLKMGGRMRPKTRARAARALS